MRPVVLTVTCAIMNVSSVGCYGQTSVRASSDDEQSQWARGVWLYSSHCASCHGENGEGYDDTPAIAGKGALPRLPAAAESARKLKLDSGADLFAYVKASMPPFDVGCLSDDQIYAVMNYVLKQADIVVAGDLSGDSAAAIKLR